MQAAGAIAASFSPKGALHLEFFDPINLRLAPVRHRISDEPWLSPAHSGTFHSLIL